MEGLQKNVKSLIQDKWTLGQYSNGRPGRIQSGNTDRSQYDIV